MYRDGTRPTFQSLFYAGVSLIVNYLVATEDFWVRFPTLAYVYQTKNLQGRYYSNVHNNIFLYFRNCCRYHMARYWMDSGSYLGFYNCFCYIWFYDSNALMRGRSGIANTADSRPEEWRCKSVRPHFISE